MPLAAVYHIHHNRRKPGYSTVTARIEALAAQGLSHGAILARLVISEHGGFVPKEELARILNCSVRQVLRYLAELRQVKEREAGQERPVTSAGPSMTEPSHVDRLEQAGSNTSNPSYEPVVVGSKDNNRQAVSPSSTPDLLQEEIQTIAKEWRVPKLAELLPSRIEPAIRETGGYIPGTLTAAWEVAHRAWLTRHCYNRVGYLIGVFRQMLPEVYAWIEELKERIGIIRIAAKGGGIDVQAEIEKQLEYWEEVGGAPAVAAGALRLAIAG